MWASPLISLAGEFLEIPCFLACLLSLPVTSICLLKYILINSKKETATFALFFFFFCFFLAQMDVEKI